MPRNRKAVDPVVRELEAIKKLLILQLVAAGVRATDIAKVLGMDKGDFSRLVPTRGLKIKKIGTANA